MKVTSPPDGESSMRGVRPFAARAPLLAVAIGVGWLGVVCEAEARGDRSRSSQAESPEVQWWVTEHWTIRGERIERTGSRVRVEQAVAEYRAAEEPSETLWQMRADRLEARVSVSAPHRMRSMYARGAVRVSGPPPLYLAGTHAASLAPGESLRIWEAGDRGGGTRLLGEGWTLVGSGARIELDGPEVTLEELADSRPKQRNVACKFGS